MINLLPQEEIVQLRKEYRLRVFFLGAVLLLVVFIISGVSLVPSYLLSKFKERQAQDQYNLLVEPSISEGEEKLRQQIEDTSNNLDILSEIVGENHISLYKLIEDVTKKRPKGIKTSSFSLIKNRNEFIIEGTADKRDTLLSFSNSLKEINIFEDVTLPIASLARESDIVFILTLRLSS